MRKLKILVGCEESQIVTNAFRELGFYNTFSCDLLETSGSHPEWHLKMDIFEAIDLCKWDLIILHPPCTKIAVSGNRWYGEGTELHNERLEAVRWTEILWRYATSNCKFVVLENPVGTLNKYGNFPRPQYIQPWQFGHGEQKKTGLWRHNLPLLQPTNIVSGREQKIWKMPPSADRAKLRSKTYPGIARAMTVQWSEYILRQS